VRLIRREAYVSLSVTLAMRFSVLPAVHPIHTEPDTSGVLVAKRRVSPSVFLLAEPDSSPVLLLAGLLSSRQACFLSPSVLRQYLSRRITAHGSAPGKGCVVARKYDVWIAQVYDVCAGV
jgi:hypothetical protein